MDTLQTSFAGLSLRNPIIISSSGLTNSAKKIQKLAQAGAGAVVLKSLFEEQIDLEVGQMHATAYYPEGGEYLEAAVRNSHIAEYLNLIKEAKQLCNIPIIASINCYSGQEWVAFAQAIEIAGADALEINILALQSEVNYKYGTFEQEHIQTLNRIRQQVQIPVIMKLGHNLTNPVALINQLHANGAKGIVLFNRFYQPDINIDTITHASGEMFSTPATLAESLRWVGIASAAVNGISYAVSGGVHSGADMVKAILAGASAVEVCSTIYQNGEGQIKTMLDFMQHWMAQKGFDHIAAFRAKLNVKDLSGVNTFERTQFLRYYSQKE